MNKKQNKVYIGKKNKAVVLDRDGTLNYDDGYTYKTKDFKLLPNVIEALKLLIHLIIPGDLFLCQSHSSHYPVMLNKFSCILPGLLFLFFFVFFTCF